MWDKGRVECEEYDRLPPIVQARVPIGHPGKYDVTVCLL